MSITILRSVGVYGYLLLNEVEKYNRFYKLNWEWKKPKRLHTNYWKLDHEKFWNFGIPDTKCVVLYVRWIQPLSWNTIFREKQLY